MTLQISSYRSKTARLNCLRQAKRKGPRPQDDSEDEWTYLETNSNGQRRHRRLTGRNCGALDNHCRYHRHSSEMCPFPSKEQDIGVATFIGCDKMKVWEKNMAPHSCSEDSPRLLTWTWAEPQNGLPERQKRLESGYPEGQMKCEEGVSRVQSELEENEKAMAELTEQLKKLEDEAGEIMKDCQEAEAALPEVQEQYHGVLKEIKVLQQQEHTLQEESLSVRLRIEQIETTITEHNNKIKHWQKEASKLSLHTIEDKQPEELPVLTPAELEKISDPNIIINKMITLETQCAQMKPNLGAIAEYKKKEELYLQRVAQLDEITTERDRFKRGYEDLRKQRLNEFMTGFNMITNKLKENYQMLTLGGDAELELVDSLDPFSEGIMFSVRPPKKSWKKIFNLSGGEKTLSSLALVFALHHYKPTPLYFMDEIDAALDFKNVSIVACYIYEQTKNAQFIIISLRNNMFEIADRLIGIYKTHNTTKSVGINPKTIVFKEHDAVTA
ncbi:structural maintenance of chromosomes protein 4 isoform X1 [Lates japonicus]|uniref:Structural maintenance of chromosomes protein 4 n=1 Tax=Lates japonicus TaxID=270547 RepID=A0AAD3RLB4_LATJO|nr:structural maintenance of chromosomes protein 4 isoform X1 [Lates japonicus]